MKFEEAIAELEEINRRMAEERVPLDEALELYERGVRLCAECEKRLTDAKGRFLALEEGRERLLTD